MADGLRNLLADLREGRLSMTDTEAFAPGKNLAITPGKVVYRNRLIELIQYAPLTTQTYAVPLLFIPPWINKFYILDLQPKNSLVRFLVEQGFSVFMISWKNPDASMEGITFEDYMTDGPLAASDVVREITGAAAHQPGRLLHRRNAAGDDAGLSGGAARRPLRSGHLHGIAARTSPRSATRRSSWTSRRSSSWSSRCSSAAISTVSDMANMFNLLRSNDLIWNTVINNYLMGNKPPAFDLLYWNNDGTRMAQAAHSFYLRNTYLENNLIKPGKISLLDQPIDLRRIRQDIYAIGAEKDHIVPMELGLADSAADKCEDPLRAGCEWAHRRHDQPAVHRQRRPLDRTRPAMRRRPGRRRRGWPARKSTTAAGGAIGPNGSRPAPERECRRRLSASAAYPPIGDAPGTYVLEK